MSYVNIQYRMPDVRCRTSFGGGFPSCFKGTRSPAHSKANGLCLSYSNRFIFSLATSITVSETRSLHPKKGLWLLSIGLASGPAKLSQLQTASGSVREPHIPILVQQDSFSLLPKGLEEGVLHVQWQHIPPEFRGGCGLHGPLQEQISLEWTGMG